MDKLNSLLSEQGLKKQYRFGSLDKSDKFDNSVASKKDDILTDFCQGVDTGLEESILENEDLQALLPWLVAYFYHAQVGPIKILATLTAIVEYEAKILAKKLVEAGE